MDDETNINLEKGCDCNINLSIRNIIEIGLKPTIQNMTTTIAASLTNTQMFGNYEVHFSFVMGNVFNLTTGSIMYTIYTKILQEAYEDSIAMKGKDVSGYIIQENIFQLSLPAKNELPFMYDSFTIGNMYQVAKETYGVYVSSFAEKDRLSYDPQLCDVNFKGDHGTDLIDTKSLTIVVLQKGQHIPSTGLVKNLDMVFRKSKGYLYGDERDLVLGEF